MSLWTDLDITNPSFWTLVGTQINTTGGGGSGAKVFAITTGGVITSLNIISGGTGYTANFSPTITGSGTGASVTLTVAGGAVTGYTSLVGGTGYLGTAPAWNLNFAANVWSVLLSSIANLRANINGNGMTISNLGGLTITGSPVTLDTNGDLSTSGYLATRQLNTTALVNGANQNISIGNTGLLRINYSGPTAAFSLGGFAGGVDGRRLTVLNLTTMAMTINEEDTGSTAGNRIQTYQGNVTLRTGNSTADFIFSVNDNRWILLGHN